MSHFFEPFSLRELKNRETMVKIPGNAGNNLRYLDRL